MSDFEKATRRAVRRSARVCTLRGYGHWKRGAYALINAARALGLSEDAIREEWRRGAERAEHLLEVLRTASDE